MTNWEAYSLNFFFLPSAQVDMFILHIQMFTSVKLHLLTVFYCVCVEHRDLLLQLFSQQALIQYKAFQKTTNMYIHCYCSPLCTYYLTLKYLSVYFVLLFFSLNRSFKCHSSLFRCCFCLFIMLLYLQRGHFQEN